MFLYYRGVNPNVAVNGNVKFVDISECRSKRVKLGDFITFNLASNPDLLTITYRSVFRTAKSLNYKYQ